MSEDRNLGVVARNPSESAERHTGLVFLLIFGMLAAGIVAIGYLAYRNYENRYRAEVDRQLSAIAELKVGELKQWRKDRREDGAILFKNAAFSDLVRRFLENPADADAERQLQAWLGKYQAHDQYDKVRLQDAQGITRLSVPAGLPAVSTTVAKNAAEVLRSGQVTFQDFFRSEHDQQIRLGILVPILDGQDDGRPLGTVFLRIDPNIYLYPFIKRWPISSPTAETLLVHREGNDVVFLNELRFQANAALNLRFPLDRTALPAAQAVLGLGEVMDGFDYRDKPVVAAVRTIPDSPWSLVAKMDIAEVYAPMRERLWQIIFMVAVLLFAAGAGVGWVWRQQKIKFYQEQYRMSEANGTKLRDKILRELNLQVQP